MAKGAVLRRAQGVLAVAGVIALFVVTGLIVGWNPWPQAFAWVGEQVTTVTDPAPEWSVRASGPPDRATVTDRAVVVTSRGIVEAYSIRDGSVLWRRDARWAGVAGADAAAVVLVAGEQRGFEAVDAGSGAVRWSDRSADAVWAYRDAVLVLTCSGSGCALTSRAPADGAVRWRTGVPVAARALGGLDEPLAAPVSIGDAFGGAVAGAPAPLPPALGLPLDGRVLVLAADTGRKLRDEPSGQRLRVSVAENRLVSVTAVRRDDACRYTVEGRDAATGRRVWRTERIDPRTAAGAACEQRRHPAGAGPVLLAARSDGRTVLVSVADGREVWAAGAGETVVDTDGRVALVRASGKDELRAVDVASGAVRWKRQVGGRADVALTPEAVLIVDPRAGRVVALDRESGRPRVDVRTGATVAAYGEAGVLVVRGRTIAWLPYS